MDLSQFFQFDSVLADEFNDKGILTLNRPKQLNALHFEMAEKIFNALNKWQHTKSMIIIKSSDDKAFCAGGDLKRLIDPNQYEMGVKFFKIEYTTYFLIANLKIPWISLIDGYVMGSGVGCSIHGKYRIATERTIFAMPETMIGAMPDIGGSFFLPRLQGYLGYYLGLTGSRLHGIDTLYAGIATHFCPSQKIPALEQALINSENGNEIEDVLNEFCPHVNGEFSLAKYREQIDTCFSASTIEEILLNLENDGSDWALQTIRTLKKASPTCLKLTLREFQFGSTLSLGECLQMEYRLVHRIIKHNDFRDGVSAVLVRKDNKPKWNPSKIKDVTDEQISYFFGPFANGDELPIPTKLLMEF